MIFASQGSLQGGCPAIWHQILFGSQTGLSSPAVRKETFVVAALLPLVAVAVELTHTQEAAPEEMGGLQHRWW